MQLLLFLFVIFVALEVIQRILNWILTPLGLTEYSKIPSLENKYSLETILEEKGYKIEDYIPGSACELLVNCEGRRRYEELCAARENNRSNGIFVTIFFFVSSVIGLLIYCAVNHIL